MVFAVCFNHGSRRVRTRRGRISPTCWCVLYRPVRSKQGSGSSEMKATEKLHAAGQSLWLDNITRDLLASGTLKRYIDTLSVTGLTSNPTIFDHAIAKSAAYDADIR